MTTPIGSDDAYPEQIATEFVRTTRNNEQEWKNRALAAELNLACEKRDAREVIGALQKELDAALAQASQLNDSYIKAVNMGNAIAIKLESERDSYKESAESWSTRAAQEDLRADEAEQLRCMEQDRRLEAEKDLQNIASESKTARQSRARLVYGIREWRARFIHYGHRMSVRSMLAYGENHRLQTELDAAHQELLVSQAQVQRLREALEYSKSEWRKLRDAAQDTSMFAVMFGCEDVLQRIDALRGTEPHGETEPQP